MRLGRKFFSRFLLVVVPLFLFPFSARAGGLWVNEMGTPDVGTAAAGRAASALDASTAWGNPAGMTRLAGSELVLGLQPMFVDSSYRVENTSTDGDRDGQAGAWFPQGGAFYVHDVSENLKLGLTFGSYFGLGLDYGEDWAGRYYVQDALLLTSSLVPTVGYKVNDWLSVGAGPILQYALMKQDTAINSLLDRRPDASLQVEDDSFGVGGEVGVLVEPIAGTRLGLTYITSIDHDFEDTAEVDGVGPIVGEILGRADRELDLGITVPQQVMFSVHQDVTEDFAVLGTVSWQKWSEYGQVSASLVSSDVTDLTVDQNFSDTWNFAVGARYRLTPGWTGMIGFAYDDSPVSIEDRTPLAPFDRVFRYSAGIIHELSDTVSTGFQYELMDTGDAQFDVERGALAGRVTGDYDTNFVHVFSMNIIWKL